MTGAWNVANSATAIFDAEDSAIQKVAARITSVLLFLENKFAGTKLEVQADATAAAGQIDQLNGRYQALAQNIQSTSNGGGFAGMLTNAAHSASFLTTTIGGISSALLRAAPLVKFLPDTFARWVPGVKAAVAEHEGLIAKTALAASAQQALAGRLTLVDAVLAGVNMETLGATRRMAILGAAGSYAGSQIVAAMRSAAGGVSRLIGRTATAMRQMLSLGASSLLGGGGMIGGVFGGMLGAGSLLGFGAGTMKAFDAGGKFNDLSNQTGLAVDELVIMGQEARNAGKEVGFVAGAVNKMQKALASGDASEVLTQLGLDLDALKTATPLSQFQQIGRAIAALPSPTDRSAAAMKLFGKSGAELLSMFASRGFGDAAVQVGGQAAILARNAVIFDDVSDKLALAGVKVQGFFVGVAEKVAPVIKPMLDQLAAMDGAGIGQRVGDDLAAGLQMFTDGSLADSIGLTISIAIGEAINFLTGGMLASVAAFNRAMFEGFKLQREAFRMVLDPRTLFRGKASFVDTLGAQLKQSLEGVKASFGEGFEKGKFIDTNAMNEMLATNMERAFSNASNAQARAIDQLPTVIPDRGASTLDLGAGSGANNRFNVSNLQRLGGAVGLGGGGDPLIEANRLARESLSVERQILAAILGRSDKITGGVAASLYQ